MTELDEMREQMRNILLAPSDGWNGFCMVGCHYLFGERKWENCEFRSTCHDELIKLLLSLETDTCRIAVVRKEGVVPAFSYAFRQLTKTEVLRLAREDILSAGWVKEVKDE